MIELVPGYYLPSLVNVGSDIIHHVVLQKLRNIKQFVLSPQVLQMIWLLEFVRGVGTALLVLHPIDNPLLSWNRSNHESIEHMPRFSLLPFWNRPLRPNGRRNQITNSDSTGHGGCDCDCDDRFGVSVLDCDCECAPRRFDRKNVRKMRLKKLLFSPGKTPFRKPL